MNSVCFSPDGKQIASGGGDRTAKVWNALTGQEKLTFQGHTGAVNSVCFSPNGKQLASGGDDRTAKVWDALTGQEKLSFKGHMTAVYRVCFSPDGKRIASGALDNGTLKVWAAETGQEKLTLTGHSDSVYSVCFSPDGKQIASSGKDRTVRVWDGRQGLESAGLRGAPVAGDALRMQPQWSLAGQFRWRLGGSRATRPANCASGICTQALSCMTLRGTRAASPA